MKGMELAFRNRRVDDGRISFGFSLIENRLSSLGHSIYIMIKAKELDAGIFYMNKTI